MVDSELRLEAISAVLKCSVKSLEYFRRKYPGAPDPPLLQPQDVVDITLGIKTSQEFISEEERGGELSNFTPKAASRPEFPWWELGIGAAITSVVTLPFAPLIVPVAAAAFSWAAISIALQAAKDKTSSANEVSSAAEPKNAAQVSKESDVSSAAEDKNAAKVSSAPEVSTAAPEVSTAATEVSTAPEVSTAAPEVSTAPKVLTAAELSTPEVYVKEEDFFDPRWDYDFTNIKDKNRDFKRGDEQYSRPCGWKRLALKVLGKYEDGDGWLGRGADAWPVSYHGTSKDGAMGIIQTHYKAGSRQKYGRGIYSTPNINIAVDYSTKFKSEKTNKKYRVILQNRINPNKREKCSRKDYWLVPVEGKTSDNDEKLISQDSIRPYGLLVKEVKN